MKRCPSAEGVMGNRYVDPVTCGLGLGVEARKHEEVEFTVHSVFNPDHLCVPPMHTQRTSEMPPPPDDLLVTPAKGIRGTKGGRFEVAGRDTCV